MVRKRSSMVKAGFAGGQVKPVFGRSALIAAFAIAVRSKGMRGTGLLICICALALFFFRSSVYSADFSSWQYNRTFTITAPGTDSFVTYFPVMVRLNGKVANGGNANDSIVFATAQNNGWDIRFSSTGATDSIPFEIQRYDSTNKVAIFWVLVGSIASGSTNTTFNMYWGKSGLTATPSNPNGVFAQGGSGNGFESVYHLREATGADITDATANGYNMTANGTITQSAGVNPNTDSSEAFDGSTGYYNGTSPNVSFHYIFTVSGWFYTTVSNNGGIFSTGGSGWDYGKVSFYFGDGTTNQGVTGINPGMVGYSRDYIISSTAMGTGGWHHIAWVFNYNGGSQYRQMYIDGAAQTTVGNYNTTIGTADSTPVTTWLGQSNCGEAQNAFYSGQMQEFRIDTVVRSSDWIKLSYETQRDTSIVSGGAITSSAVIPTLQKIAGAEFKVNGSMIAYSLNKSCEMDLSFYDMLGRAIYAVHRFQSAGQYKISLKNLDLAKGLYTMRFKAAGIEKQEKVFLSR